jgi:hypothetical protein
MKVYKGIREAVAPYPPEAFVYVETDGVGRVNFERVMLYKSLQIRNHSPTGFEWGYGGSGPHQLALALLMDATGDTDLAERLYSSFLTSHVLRWDREGFSVSDDYIKAWAKNQKV